MDARSDELGTYESVSVMVVPSDPAMSLDEEYVTVDATIPMETTEEEKPIKTFNTTKHTKVDNKEPSKKTSHKLRNGLLLTAGLILLTLAVVTVVDLARLGSMQIQFESIQANLVDGDHNGNGIVTQAKVASSSSACVNAEFRLHDGPKYISAEMSALTCELAAQQAAEAETPLLRFDWIPSDSNGQLAWNDRTIVNSHSVRIENLNPLAVRTVLGHVALKLTNSSSSLSLELPTLSTRCSLTSSFRVWGVPTGSWTFQLPSNEVELSSAIDAMSKASNKSKNKKKSSSIFTNGSLNIKDLFRFTPPADGPLASLRSLTLTTPALRYDFFWDWEHLLASSSMTSQSEAAKYFLAAQQHLHQFHSGLSKIHPLPIGMELAVSEAKLELVAPSPSTTESEEEMESSLIAFSIRPILPFNSSSIHATKPCVPIDELTSSSEVMQDGSLAIRIVQCRATGEDEARSDESVVLQDDGDDTLSKISSVASSSAPSASASTLNVRRSSFLSEIIGSNHLFELAPTAASVVSLPSSSLAESSDRNTTLSMCFGGYINAYVVGGLGGCFTLGMDYDDVTATTTQIGSIQIAFTQLFSIQVDETVQLAGPDTIMSGRVDTKLSIANSLRSYSTMLLGGQLSETGYITIKLSESGQEPIDPAALRIEFHLQSSWSFPSPQQIGVECQFATMYMNTPLVQTQFHFTLDLNLGEGDLSLWFTTSPPENMEMALEYKAKYWLDQSASKYQFQLTGSTTTTDQYLSNLALSGYFSNLDSYSFSFQLIESPSKTLPDLHNSRVGASLGWELTPFAQTFQLVVDESVTFQSETFSNGQLNMVIPRVVDAGAASNNGASISLIESPLPISSGQPRVQDSLTIFWQVNEAAADDSSTLTFNATNSVSWFSSPLSSAEIIGAVQFPSHDHQPTLLSTIVRESPAGVSSVNDDGLRIYAKYNGQWEQSSGGPMSALGITTVQGKTLYQNQLLTNVEASLDLASPSESVSLSVYEGDNLDLNHLTDRFDMVFDYYLSLGSVGLTQLATGIKVYLALAQQVRTNAYLNLDWDQSTRPATASFQVYESRYPMPNAGLSPFLADLSANYSVAWMIDQQPQQYDLVTVHTSGLAVFQGVIITNSVLDLTFDLSSAGASHFSFIESPTLATPQAGSESTRLELVYDSTWQFHEADGYARVSSNGSIEFNRGQFFSQQRLDVSVIPQHEIVQLSLLESPSSDISNAGLTPMNSRIASSYQVNYHFVDPMPYTLAVSGTTNLYGKLSSNLIASTSATSHDYQLTIMEAPQVFNPKTDRIYLWVDSNWQIPSVSLPPSSSVVGLYIDMSISLFSQCFTHLTTRYGLDLDRQFSSLVIQHGFTLDPIDKSTNSALFTSSSIDWSNPQPNQLRRSYQVDNEIWWQSQLVSNSSLELTMPRAQNNIQSLDEEMIILVSLYESNTVDSSVMTNPRIDAQYEITFTQQSQQHQQPSPWSVTSPSFVLHVGGSTVSSGTLLSNLNSTMQFSSSHFSVLIGESSTLPVSSNHSPDPNVDRFYADVGGQWTFNNLDSKVYRIEGSGVSTLNGECVFNTLFFWSTQFPRSLLFILAHSNDMNSPPPINAILSVATLINLAPPSSNSPIHHYSIRNSVTWHNSTLTNLDAELTMNLQEAGSLSVKLIEGTTKNLTHPLTDEVRLSATYGADYSFVNQFYRIGVNGSTIFGGNVLTNGQLHFEASSSDFSLVLRESSQFPLSSTPVTTDRFSVLLTGALNSDPDTYQLATDTTVGYSGEQVSYSQLRFLVDMVPTSRMAHLSFVESPSLASFDNSLNRIWMDHTVTRWTPSSPYYAHLAGVTYFTPTPSPYPSSGVTYFAPTPSPSPSSWSFNSTIDLRANLDLDQRTAYVRLTENNQHRQGGHVELNYDAMWVQPSSLTDLTLSSSSSSPLMIHGNGTFLLSNVVSSFSVIDIAIPSDYRSFSVQFIESPLESITSPSLSPFAPAINLNETRIAAHYDVQFEFDNDNIVYQLGAHGATFYQAELISRMTSNVAIDHSHYHYEVTFYETPVPPQPQSLSASSSIGGVSSSLFPFDPSVTSPIAPWDVESCRHAIGANFAILAAGMTQDVPFALPSSSSSSSSSQISWVAAQSPHMAFVVDSVAKIDWFLTYDVSTIAVVNYQYYLDEFLNSQLLSQLSSSSLTPFRRFLHQVGTMIHVPAAVGFNLRSFYMREIAVDIGMMYECVGQQCFDGPQPPIDSSSGGYDSSSTGGVYSSSSTGYDPSPASNDPSSHELSVGAKAGIGVGVSIGGIILIALLIFVVMKKKKDRSRLDDTLMGTAELMDKSGGHYAIMGR